MPSEESKKTCLLTITGAHTGVAPAHPPQDHIPQLLPSHGDLGSATSGALASALWAKEVSASMSNTTRDTAVANPNFFLTTNLVRKGLWSWE